MRTRVPLVALAAFLLCANSACRRLADAHNLATVDSLLVVTDSLINGMNALDMAAVSRINSILRVQKGHDADPHARHATKEEALLLGNYHRTMTKSMGRAKKDHGTVLQELTVARTQLSDLRNDMEKALLEREVEVKYISDERLELAKARHDADVVASMWASSISGMKRAGATRWIRCWPLIPYPRNEEPPAALLPALTLVLHLALPRKARTSSSRRSISSKAISNAQRSTTTSFTRSNLPRTVHLSAAWR